MMPTSPTQEPDVSPEQSEVSSVILHVPHASRLIPPAVRAGITITDKELTSELDEITDTATDLIATYAARALDQKPRISINALSRLVVDPERFPDDREELNAVGRGAVYTRTCSGREMRVQDQERDAKLIAEYYDPYARKLTELVDERLEATGAALIIDIHSYPREPSDYELHKKSPRPEICIGVDDSHTPDWLRELAIDKFAAEGFADIAINEPFAGAYIPLKHFNSDYRVLGLMIEVRRDVYLDDGLLPKDHAVQRIGRAIASIVRSASEEPALQLK